MKYIHKFRILAILGGWIAACTSTAASSEVAKYGTREGPRFVHQVTAADCVLIETQWEKQADGSRVLWEETKIPLRGASLFDLAVYDLANSAENDDAARPRSTMLNATDAPVKPLPSITVLAPKGRPGVVETLATRRLAQTMIKRKKAKASPRNGGGTHVTFPVSQVLILWRGRDVASQLAQLEQAISEAIAACNPIS